MITTLTLNTAATSISLPLRSTSPVQLPIDDYTLAVTCSGSGVVRRWLYGAGVSKELEARVPDSGKLPKLTVGSDYVLKVQQYRGGQIDMAVVHLRVVPAVATSPVGRPAMEKAIIDPDALPLNYLVQTPAGQVTWLELLRAARVVRGRTWCSKTPHADTVITAADFAAERALALAGIPCTVCLAREQWGGRPLPTAAETREFARNTVDAVGNIPGLRVQFGNEPNHGGYWPGNDLARFVECSNAFYEILHAAGIEVISGAITYSVAAVKKILDAGLQADAIGFHAYRDTPESLEKLMGELVAVTGTRVIDHTEWGLGIPASNRYRLAVNPDDVKGVKPALPASEATASLRGQWEVMKKFPTMRTAAYFTSDSTDYAKPGDWRHPTGPTALLRTTVVSGKRAAVATTPFWDDFYLGAK
jgi:hypothetical protein